MARRAAPSSRPSHRAAKPAARPAGPAKATGDEWTAIFNDLLTRSGALCEARTVACLVPNGRLERLTRDQVSIQHRRARGMGGTDLPDTNTLGNLLLICGTGVSGCHGWIECDERGLAEDLGFWVKHTTDESGAPVPSYRYPVRIGGVRGQWRLLEPVIAAYRELPLALRWSETMPICDV